MPTNDSEYYRERAAQERDLAAAAPSQMVANIHAKLAKRYDELAADPDKGGLRRAGDETLGK